MLKPPPIVEKARFRELMMTKARCNIKINLPSPGKLSRESQKKRGIMKYFKFGFEPGILFDRFTSMFKIFVLFMLLTAQAAAQDMSYLDGVTISFPKEIVWYDDLSAAYMGEPDLQEAIIVSWQERYTYPSADTGDETSVWYYEFRVVDDPQVAIQFMEEASMDPNKRRPFSVVVWKPVSD